MPMDQISPSSTLQSIRRIDLFGEFLAATIHAITYVTKIYPPTLYEPRQLFGTLVYVCMAQPVSDYIHGVTREVVNMIIESEAHGGDGNGNGVAGIGRIGIMAQMYQKDCGKSDQPSIKTLVTKYKFIIELLEPKDRDKTYWTMTSWTAEECRQFCLGLRNQLLCVTQNGVYVAGQMDTFSVVVYAKQGNGDKIGGLQFGLRPNWMVEELNEIQEEKQSLDHEPTVIDVDAEQEIRPVNMKQRRPRVKKINDSQYRVIAIRDAHDHVPCFVRIEALEMASNNNP